MNPATAGRIAAAAGLTAMALGAVGAHGLKNLLGQNGTAEIWEKAVFYHFIHAVKLFILAERKKLPVVAWWSFLAGIIIFSGLALFAGGDEHTLAGRNHTCRRVKPHGGLAGTDAQSAVVGIKNNPANILVPVGHSQSDAAGGNGKPLRLGIPISDAVKFASRKNSSIIDFKTLPANYFFWRLNGWRNEKSRRQFCRRLFENK